MQQVCDGFQNYPITILVSNSVLVKLVPTVIFLQDIQILLKMSIYLLKIWIYQKLLLQLVLSKFLMITIVPCLYHPPSETLTLLHCLQLNDIVQSQKLDSIISPVYENVLSGVKPLKQDLKHFSRKSRLLFRYFSHLKINDSGILIKRISNQEQIVLPKCYHRIVFDEFHVMFCLIFIQIVFQS